MIENLRDHDFLDFNHDTQAPKKEALPINLILDNLRSTFNVGSLFRTAECLGFQRIFLTGYTADPTNPKVFKTSMGTSETIPWQRHESLLSLLGQQRPVIALETVDSAPSLYDFDFPKSCTLVIGNEKYGLSKDTLEKVDHVIQIPMRGRKNSLNVAVALGVVAFEISRQWNRNSQMLGDFSNLI
jgi:23S rRNA (guanosine2251-2'-O)-methyltransferase